MDLTQIPTDQLMQMYQQGLQQSRPSPVQTIQQLESNNAPDSSTITSPKGAQGSMQVMPETAKNPGFGIKPTNGTPEDTARVGREYYSALQQKYGNAQMAAIAYNMGPDATDKWLKNGADLSKLPTETLKYAYNFGQAQPAQGTPAASANVPAPQGPVGPPASAATKQGLLANLEGVGLQGANIVAGGLEALPIGGAAVIGAGRRLLEGQTVPQAIGGAVEQAGQNFQTFSPENALNKLGVNTTNLHGTAGYSIPEKVMNAAFETAPSILGEGMARTGELEAGMSPSEYTPEAGQQAKQALQFGMLAAPVLHLAGGRAPISADDLGNKLGTGNWDEPGTQPLPGEFVGPASPEEFARANQGATSPFYPEGVNDVIGSNRNNLRQQQFDFENGELQTPSTLSSDSNGVTSTPEVMNQSAPFRNAQNIIPYGTHQDNLPMMVNGDSRLFQLKDGSTITIAKSPEETAGAVAPGYTPSENDPAKFTAYDTQGNPIGSMSFSPGDRALDVEVNPEYRRKGVGSILYDLAENHGAQIEGGESLGTLSQSALAVRESRVQRGFMGAHVDEFNRAVLSGQNLDMFSDITQRRFDQMGPDEQPRALTKDEFTQTLENLASQEGTRFDMPENPDLAYDKYLDTVTDQQGGLFDRPTIAKNFVDMAAKEAVDRFTSDHPIVKANQAKVDAAQLAFDNAIDHQTKAMAAGDLRRATDILEKSQANIAKFYQGDADRWGVSAKDGIIHMNMGAPIPDWIKTGVMNMLRGLHGVVVRFLNRKLSMPTNLDSPTKIVQAAIKKGLNDAANKSVDSRVNEKQVNFIQKAPGLSAADRIKEFVPDNRPYEEAKPELAAAKDMDSSWVTKNITSQGGIWASAMSKSPTVKWAFTKVQDALKGADFEQRRLLTNNKDGLKTLMTNMNDRERGEIHARMDLDEGVTMRTDSELRQMGFNEKQRAYYQRFHEVMNEILNKFNDGLQKAGLPTVDKRVAYMASRFMGDFRSMIYQKGTTKPVGFVGAHTKFAVDGIKAKLEEQNPGKYDFEDTTLNRGPNGRVSPNMFQGYMNVLNHFELNDPEMKAIMDTYREYFTSNAAKALSALQHAKDKTGIMGAEGRKAWLSHEKNASEGMKSQLTYADHMIKWSNLQDAASQIKEMMSDPDINQPNAKSYVKDYLANAMGQNNSPFANGIASLVDGVAEKIGIGPSVFRKMNGYQKSALLQMWLGFFRIPHAMLTMTQFLQSNPAMAELVRSRGAGNFWANSYKGLSTTMNMAMKSMKPSTELKGFDKDIWDYQQKNQVFNANLTSHLTDINTGKAGQAFRHIMEANITYPEMAIRSSTFSIWAHTLKESGMSTQEALGTAENLTRAALVDYRPSERPLVFGKMGMMGDIASTLTRFKMNQLSQHQYFAKEAARGSFTPMATLLASSIAFAGVSGLMGYNYADQLYQLFTEHLLGKPDTLKAVMLRNLPDWANYGMFAQLGINMQGSFSNADTIPDNLFASLFPTGDTVKNMAMTVGQAAYYHDEASLKRLIYNFSPTSLKGIEENQMFSKDVGNGNKLFYNPNTGEAQSVRTPGEQTARDLAFHPIQEARDRDVRSSVKDISDMYQNLRDRDLQRIKNQMATGTLSQSDMDTFRQDWQQHRGDASAANSILQYAMSQHLTANQRMVPQGPVGIETAHRLQDLFSMGGNIKR